MALPTDVLDGIAEAMEQSVSDLTTALSREADAADNTVEFPHGETVVISNIRAESWNTDFVDWVTDSNGNEIGRLFDALFEMEVQCNIWLGVPSDDYDIQSLGETLERGLREYDSKQYDADLPAPGGGTVGDVDTFYITDGGMLPTEDNQPPLRGYRVDTRVLFKDRIDTTVEYGESGPYVVTIDSPSSGDITDGVNDNVAIEYQAT